MYTVDNEEENLYENEYEEPTSYNNRGIIIKVIIIILCIIVLIWLISSLKNNRNSSDNSEVHSANVEKVRLAAEDYFFIKNNKDNTKSVSLAKLKSDGLVQEIVDANKKVCNENSSKVSLDNDIDAYKMTVSLSCSTNDKEEVFYYHKNTLACLNCNGKQTKMSGNNSIIAKADENKNNSNNETNANTNNESNNNESEYTNYSCTNWTNWSSERIVDSSLEERVKVLVQGVKYGTKTTYSDWSEYTTTPIVGGDGIEIETKTVTENVWSENKTGTNIDENNQNIKIISKEVVNEISNCENGFIENNICYSNKTTVGNLTMEEYNSGKYKIKKDRCEGVKTLKNNEGKYVLTYVDCEYNEIIGKSNTGKSYTIYTYQELKTKEVTYYRYRTINTINEPDEYTEKKYQECELPEGFVKVEGSEETYYSYKLRTCEK